MQYFGSVSEHSAWIAEQAYDRAKINIASFEQFTPDEVSRSEQFNSAYTSKFDFPRHYGR